MSLERIEARERAEQSPSSTDREAVARLKPCPFCGGKARLENYIIEAVAFCTQCDARLIRSHAAREDKGIAEAITAWNTRSATPVEGALVEALRDARRRLVASGDLFGANEVTIALSQVRPQAPEVE